MTDTKRPQTIYCFLGLPASGKGTQAAMLAEKIGSEVLGMGSLIREELEDADLTDPFYINMEKKYKDGVPQSDEVILDIVKKHLDKHTGKSIIFDNFPFSQIQAELFFNLCQEMKVSEPVLFVVNISPETAIKRIVHRKVCDSCGAVYVDNEVTMCEKCGGALITRSDDNVETVENRIKFYLPRIEEVKNIFSMHNTIHIVDGEQSIEDVFKQIEQVI